MYPSEFGLRMLDPYSHFRPEVQWVEDKRVLCLPFFLLGFRLLISILLGKSGETPELSTTVSFSKIHSKTYRPSPSDRTIGVGTLESSLLLREGNRLGSSMLLSSGLSIKYV